MEQPLVSIVTITRNRGRLLGRCISSVLGQSYSNIEHIVVDGASNDNTDEVVMSFNDDRLHFIKLDKNWPIKETLDHGISFCKGKYITFLDSDDEYMPFKIEKQVSLFETLTEDYGFIYCWMTYYDDTTKRIIRYHKPELRGYVPDKVVSCPVLSGTPTLMFRADAIRDLDGWKSQDEIGIVSDWELCARACQKYKVDYVPESLVNVFINHGSIRQSDSTYYNEVAKRNIRFHEYFLTVFNDIFKTNHKLAYEHYHDLHALYNQNKNRFKAYKYLLKAFCVDPKRFIKQILDKATK